MTRCGSSGAKGLDDSRGARGNSKTDRYSNVTSLELNFCSGEAHTGQPKSAAGSIRCTCEVWEPGQEAAGHGERASRRAGPAHNGLLQLMESRDLCGERMAWSLAYPVLLLGAVCGGVMRTVRTRCRQYHAAGIAAVQWTTGEVHELATCHARPRYTCGPPPHAQASSSSGWGQSRLRQLCSKETRTCAPPLLLHGGWGQGGPLASARNFVPPTLRELCFMPCHAASSSDAIPSHLLFAILNQVPAPTQATVRTDVTATLFYFPVPRLRLPPPPGVVALPAVRLPGTVSYSHVARQGEGRMVSFGVGWVSKAH